ncbi:MAG: chemotaxis protein CheW [Bacteroidales bacterium]|nr:chemotaxis protein CheW [Bacteroidales bacterium]
MSLQKEPYMTFRVGGRMCAVPVTNVVEVAESDLINPLPGAPGYVVGIKKFRQEILPIIDTVQRLSIPKVPSKDVPNKYAVMFEINTKNGVKKFGALVDKVLNVVEINASDIKMLDDDDNSLAGALFVKGVLTSEDGHFIYILAPENFFSNQDLQRIEKAMPSDSQETPNGF